MADTVIATVGSGPFMFETGFTGVATVPPEASGVGSELAEGGAGRDTDRLLVVAG